MSSDENDLATIAEKLAKSPDYRVLRRLTPRTEFASCEGEVTKVGILLDVETTGLNTAQDEIIELAMVKFDYLPDDRIARIADVFSSFRPEPGGTRSRKTLSSIASMRRVPVRTLCTASTSGLSAHASRFAFNAVVNCCRRARSALTVGFPDVLLMLIS